MLPFILLGKREIMTSEIIMVLTAVPKIAFYGLCIVFLVYGIKAIRKYLSEKKDK